MAWCDMTDRGDCLVQEGVTYSTISSMDAHGLEGPWSFQRDLKITLERKDRKVDPQQPKGLAPQLIQSGITWHSMMACDSTGYVFDLIEAFVPPVSDLDTPERAGV